MSTVQLVGLRQKKKKRGCECVRGDEGGGSGDGCGGGCEGALRDGVKLLPAGVYVSLGVE